MVKGATKLVFEMTGHDPANVWLNPTGFNDSDLSSPFNLTRLQTTVGLKRYLTILLEHMPHFAALKLVDCTGVLLHSMEKKSFK